MDKPVLVIVSGPPATGKTTLGHKISEEFGLPFISKDELRETLFDNLGLGDQMWSSKITLTSLDIMYYVLKNLLKAKQSCIIESNFVPENDTKKLLDIKEKFDYFPFQIQLKGECSGLFQRLQTRANQGKRHPGHPDPKTLKEYKLKFPNGSCGKLDIGGELYELDVTNSKDADYENLFSKLKLLFI